MLVILPGWGGNKKTWRQFSEIAGEHIRTICIDLPCFGDEPCPGKAWGLKDYAAFVKKKIDTIIGGEVDEDGKVILIGHSFGGQVAVYLAAEKQNIIDMMVLSAPAIYRPKKSVRRFIFSMVAKSGKLIFKLPIIEKFGPVVEKLFYRVIGSPDYTQTSGIKKQIFKKIIRHDLSDQLDKIDIPCLILWGKKDKYIPYRYSRKLHKQIKNSQLKTFERGKHGLHLQYPQKMFNSVYKFIKEND